MPCLLWVAVISITTTCPLAKPNPAFKATAIVIEYYCKTTETKEQTTPSWPTCGKTPPVYKMGFGDMASETCVQSSKR
ncbi:hypothetical protein X797_007052 [Metarhizium robertsii]|uniref:Secreted protein n=1 Tax=Metarhizium robertsii TaxID=568076 RepID=A0A014NDK9_9HYPO|nr:hypothetical protein X797_007052 [Metarhizium robertsii]